MMDDFNRRNFDPDKPTGVNVKVYNLPEEVGEKILSDEQRQMVFDQLQEEFWADADSIAREIFNCEVYAEGRSGGWCVSSRPLNEVEAKDFTQRIEELLDDYTDRIWPQRIKAAISEQEEIDRRKSLQKTILVTGNPIDGLTFIGPFEDNEAAQLEGEKEYDDWNIATLYPPENA